MKISPEAKQIISQINSETKLGDLRKIAQVIKKNHPLAMELWSTGSCMARQLAILIMDPKMLNEEVIDTLVQDMEHHPSHEQTQLMDWLMANQLMKDKKTIAQILSWAESKAVLKRRTFWYYQARLRWTGQKPPDNTDELMNTIEQHISSEAPEVQWAMNFLAGWIGVYDKKYRKRCVTLGEKTGLYKGEMVSKGCTPDYLPDFIRIESAKRNL